MLALGFRGSQQKNKNKVIKLALSFFEKPTKMFRRAQKNLGLEQKFIVSKGTERTSLREVVNSYLKTFNMQKWR